MKNKNKKGFTLMELVVVIAILAVLGLLLYPQVTKYLDSANKTTAEANARTAYTAALFESSTGGTVNVDTIQAYFTDTEVEVTNASCTGVGVCTVEVDTNGWKSECGPKSADGKAGCSAAKK